MVKIMQIVVNPDERLREKSRSLSLEEIKSAGIASFCKDMELTMQKKDGVGLAAPQVGKNIRLAVVNTKGGVLCMINPEIIKKSWAKEWGEEGCLSVPNVFGKVRRHKKIKCSYIDKEGKRKTVDAAGFFARVIQHEIDHLDGILFIDKAKDMIETRPAGKD